MLIADFAQKKVAIALFPSLLNDTFTHNVIKQFQLYINNVIANINDVCAYCGLFIPLGASILPTKVYLDFVLAIKAIIIGDDNLNYCRHINNGFHSCKFYYGMIVKKKISKFRFANCINILSCQKYPNIFNNSTPVKEVFIVFAHPVMSVRKLKPSKTSLYH